MENERLRWIDIAKGVLIVIVVSHHIPQVANKLLHLDNLKMLENYSFLYIYYFMPAFFVITGYCSNFNLSGYSFLQKNLRQLIFPSILFSLLLSWINYDFSLNSCMSRLIPLLIWGGDFWFISALFVSKILLWIENRYIKSDFFLFLVSFVFGAIGIYLKKTYCINLWNYQQGLYMNVFVCIGLLIKRREYTSLPLFKSISAIMGCSSLVLSLFLQHNMLQIPYIGKNVNISILQYPVGIVIATSGTMLVLWISMIISSNKLLEILGKHTLLIYILHINIMTECMQIMIPAMPKKIFGVLLFASIVLFATIIISTTMSWIINRYAPFLTGKFVLWKSEKECSTIQKCDDV